MADVATPRTSPRAALPEPAAAAGGVAAGRGLRRALLPWLLLPLLVAVVFFVVFPIGNAAVRVYAEQGLQPLRDMLGSRGIGQVLINTAIYTVGTVVGATTFGALLAWINERTDARVGALSGIFPILPLLIPPIGSALGYVLLFSERSGLVNVILRNALQLSGDSGPISITNFPGLILVSSINLAPLAYLVISAAFRNTDPALDEASRIAGAGHLRTIRRVTFPVIRPAIASGALVVGIMASGAFTYPLIVGTPANITTVSVHIFRLFSVWPPNEGVAITLGLLLLVFIQVAVMLQMRVSRSLKRSTVAGKRSGAAPVRLGRWKWPLRIVLMGYLFAVTLPLIGLVVGSLQPFRSANFRISDLTTQTYRDILSLPLTQESLRNSFTFGAVAATGVMVVAAVLMYVSSRGSNSLGRLVDGVSFLPSSIPHTVLGAAFLFTFSRPPLVLYGTPLLLLMAYAVAFLPQGSAAASSALSQASKELSEASYVSGAGPFRTIRKVLLPQVAPGLFAGWIIVFFLSVNEVTASSLLAGLGTSVVGHLAVDLYNNGRLADVAVLAVVVTAITGVIIALAAKTVSRAYAASKG